MPSRLTAPNCRYLLFRGRAYRWFGGVDTSTARLKTGTEYLIQQTTSSARRVFRPTSRGPGAPFRRFAVFALSDVPLTDDLIFINGQFLQGHRAAGMQPIRADTDLRSEAELSSIVKPR
jgi:hypothetical protein